MREIVLVKLNGTGVTNMAIDWAGAFIYIDSQLFRLTAKRKKTGKIGYSLIAYSVIQYFKTKL